MSARPGQTLNFIQRTCALACHEAGDVPVKVKPEELIAIAARYYSEDFEPPKPTTIRKNGNELHRTDTGHAEGKRYTLSYVHGVFSVEHEPEGDFRLDRGWGGGAGKKILEGVRNTDCDLCGEYIGRRPFMFTHVAGFAGSRIRHTSCEAARLREEAVAS